MFNLAISTCPNDTFMFDALINRRIDTKGYNFNLQLADIDELNRMALQEIPDISKISYNAFSLFSSEYQLFRTGSAIGFGNGPIIISKRKIYIDELHDVKIAIPGDNTTANLLLMTLFPNIKNKYIYIFSDIETAILDNEVDAGVIIHETRFTFQKRGLQQVIDLGTEWEKQKKLPLPLGGIVIKRNLPHKIKIDIQELVKQSVIYALNNPQDSLKFIKKYAKELSDETVKKHIDLYVNEFSIWNNEICEKGIYELLKIASEINHTKLVEPLFV